MSSSRQQSQLGNGQGGLGQVGLIAKGLALYECFLSCFAECGCLDTMYTYVTAGQLLANKPQLDIWLPFCHCAISLLSGNPTYATARRSWQQSRHGHVIAQLSFGSTESSGRSCQRASAAPQNLIRCLGAAMQAAARTRTSSRKPHQPLCDAFHLSNQKAFPSHAFSLEPRLQRWPFLQRRIDRCTDASGKHSQNMGFLHVNCPQRHVSQWCREIYILHQSEETPLNEDHHGVIAISISQLQHALTSRLLVH